MGVVHLYPPVRSDYLPPVAHLTAGLAVEGRLAQDDLHRLPFRGALDLAAVPQQGDDGGLCRERLVAQEGRL